jgi:uncharacterized protein YecE (DUF72 family)
MTKFFIGTAGWSYLRWDKDFYPKATQADEKLAFYSSQFNAVELSNSFYHTPSPEQYLTWQHEVPANFLFSVKASRFITHIKRLKDAEDTLPPFLETISLKRKNPVFFQLPPSFSINLERLTRFLTKLPKGRRYAIELHNPSWHTDEVYALLSKHKVAFCLYDTPEGVAPRQLTANFAYVRLRGRCEVNQKAFFREWKNWLNANTPEAFVFFNNRGNKSLAFGNALRFKEIA